MPDITAKDITGIAADCPHRRFLLGKVKGLPKPGDMHPCDDDFVALAFGELELFPNGESMVTVHYEPKRKANAKELLGGLEQGS